MRGTGGTSIGRRAFLRGTLAATLAWPWVRDAAGEVEVRRGSFSARASILYGMFRLDERGVWGFLSDCVAEGVALAPGPSCGEAYDGWVRLCYTAAPPDAVRRAVEVVARRLR